MSERIYFDSDYMLLRVEEEKYIVFIRLGDLGGLRLPRKPAAGAEIFGGLRIPPFKSTWSKTLRIPPF